MEPGVSRWREAALRAMLYLRQPSFALAVLGQQGRQAPIRDKACSHPPATVVSGNNRYAHWRKCGRCRLLLEFTTRAVSTLSLEIGSISHRQEEATGQAPQPGSDSDGETPPRGGQSPPARKH